MWPEVHECGHEQVGRLRGRGRTVEGPATSRTAPVSAVEDERDSVLGCVLRPV